MSAVPKVNSPPVKKTNKHRRDRWNINHISCNSSCSYFDCTVRD